jgi:hypothetical protein
MRPAAKTEMDEMAHALPSRRMRVIADFSVSRC